VCIIRVEQPESYKRFRLIPRAAPFSGRGKKWLGIKDTTASRTDRDGLQAKENEVPSRPIVYGAVVKVKFPESKSMAYGNTGNLAGVDNPPKECVTE